MNFYMFIFFLGLAVAFTQYYLSEYKDEINAKNKTKTILLKADQLQHEISLSNHKDFRYSDSIAFVAKDNKLPFSSFIVEDLSLTSEQLSILDKYQKAISEVLDSNPNASDTQLNCTALVDTKILTLQECTTASTLEFNMYSLVKGKINTNLSKDSKINNYIEKSYENIARANKNHLAKKDEGTEYNYSISVKTFETKEEREEKRLKLNSLSKNFKESLRQKDFYYSLSYISNVSKLNLGKTISMSDELLRKLKVERNKGNITEEEDKKTAEKFMEIISLSFTEETAEDLKKVDSIREYFNNINLYTTQSNTEFNKIWN